MPRRFHGRPLTTLPSVELEARTETNRLAETFVISRDSSDESESVIVELRHAGHTGYGEGAPIDRYDEDGASAVEFLDGCRGALGGDPFALDEILDSLPQTPHTQAARAALDNALYDLCGKLRQRFERLVDRPVLVHIDLQWQVGDGAHGADPLEVCLLYTSPSPRDRQKSRMPSSA